MTSSLLLMGAILVLSIAVQSAAAIAAIRMIGITGRRTAWSLVAAALVLMAVRRMVPFFRLLSGDGTYQPDLLNEVIGLALSTSMAVGISLLAPLFAERKRAEEALRTIGAYNRSLIEASLDPLVTIGPDGRITDVNAATEAVTGYCREELVGTDFSTYFTDPAKARDGYRLVFQAGLVHDYPLEIRHRQGGVTSVLYNASVYRDEEGRVLGVFAAARDITERKRAEEANKKLAAIVESSNDAIIGKDLDGIIRSWNRGAERVYGYRCEEAVGQSVAMLLPPEHQGELVEIMARLKSGERIEHYTTERIRKDGERISISLTVSPIRDGAGNIVGASSIARDDTSRKKAEAALRESEARLKEAQRLARLGSWELDLVDNALLWSDEIFRIFEIDPACFAASYDAFLGAIHPDDRDAVNAAYTTSVASRTPYDIEHRLLFEGGRIKYVHEQCETFYRDDGTPLRSVGTVQEITERKRAEEEIRELNASLERRVDERTAQLRESQQALMNIVEDLNEKTAELERANARLQELERLKSMFIASMSHELRTPLNSIIGFSSILHDEWLGKVNPEQKENLAIILRSGRHLLSLINDVIDVSKIEAGRIEVCIQEFDLFDLVMEGVAYVAKDIKDKGLDLTIETPHFDLVTDRQRLLQCLLNLLSNAMKFTQRGVIALTARVVVPAGQTESAAVEISVKDSGIGIRGEDLPKMFTPFVRLVSPGQATVPGTGLGLYLTRKLCVEILRGDIRLTSEFGTGSCFTITIPARIP